METVHATAIASAGAAALLRGPSGSGKSDLALRCLFLTLTDGAPFQLVADDRVSVEESNGDVLARAPAVLRGLLEVRGLGIQRFAQVEPVRVALIVDLVELRRVERLPEPAWDSLLGVRLPKIALAPFEASAPLKVLLALRAASLGAWGP
ncbi:MAG: HPr kinase/phosphorylase [Hyphomicrobiaceae bacterium]